MEPSLVFFQGPGPFHLPVVQRASARAVTTSVEVTLYAILDGRGPDVEAVSFQIVATRARELASLLLDAAAQIERSGCET